MDQAVERTVVRFLSGETTEPLTLRPWISAARLTTASTSGAMRASMRAVRVGCCDIRVPSIPS
jgi:hypothetical protein